MTRAPGDTVAWGLFVFFGLHTPPHGRAGPGPRPVDVAATELAERLRIAAETNRRTEPARQLAVCFG
ncbi:MAG: hypothetical protein ABEL51_09750 [Salinibacter sp.]